MFKRLFSCAALLLAAIGVAGADEYVRGYFRSNGTYVPGYYRSSPNSTVTDNYSFYGNTNPYTGSVGTNRYYSAPSSPYYDPYRSTYSGGYSFGSSSSFGSYGSTSYSSPYSYSPPRTYCPSSSYYTPLTFGR